MPVHVVEDLPDLLLGVLAPADRAVVWAHLERCPACAAARDELAEVYGFLALGLPAQEPAPSVRARVLASCGEGRLHRFAGRVSALLGLDEAFARAALDALDDSGRWRPTVVPGVSQQVVSDEPGLRKLFVRVPAGAVIPLHEHLGEERTLILQGHLLDDDGRRYAPGDEMPKTTGSRHGFSAEGGGLDLLCCVVIERGFAFVA